MKAKPKFFCEFCGAEVRQNDRVCPRCGKFFASVKCPACGFSGEAGIFRDGCPACGYAVYSSGRPVSPSVPSRHKKPVAGTDPLPWWIYAGSLVLLFVVIFLVLNLK